MPFSFDRPVLLIANDKSRRGSEVAPFEAALIDRGLQIRREGCEDPGRLPDLIRERAAAVSAVLLGGGDGTMHLAAPALRDTALPFGILPLGTANDLARSLGIEPDPLKAADVIAGGHLREIDLGIVNDIPFFNVASIGLSAAVTQRLTGIVKRRFGPLAYPIVAATTIVRYSRFSAALQVDGEETLTTTMQITVGNGRFYGGGNLVEAAAQIDDGTLDVYSLEPRARWRLLLMARAFRAGEHHDLAEVRSIKCHTLRVTTKRPHDVSADGEIVCQTPAEFGILPRAVRVFAPAGGGE